ncbi:unnamed protein product [Moneuplotes crassus]|uniref:Uncharacterized protein n=1 Tax=Euplotes crassus TaxID=5936 RepID=A0AAD1XR30_EUPCR|nr:unnamed protein product [Moneuplotes crassus]
MELYARGCAENCGHDALYYITSQDKYCCEFHYIHNDSGHKTEPRTFSISSDEVLTKLQTIDKGLQRFLNFIKIKYTGDKKEKSLAAYFNLFQKLEDLLAKISEAQASQLPSKLDSFSKEADQLRATIDKDPCFSRFLIDHVWYAASQRVSKEFDERSNLYDDSQLGFTPCLDEAENCGNSTSTEGHLDTLEATSQVLGGQMDD